MKNNKSLRYIAIFTKHQILFGAFIIGFLPLLAQPGNLHILTNYSGFKNAMVGVSVVEITSGKEIIAHNTFVKQVPASITKLITTYNALAVFGKEFRFQTKFSYKGNIQNDTLFGSIIIAASGDPTLQSRFFAKYYGIIADSVALALKQKGINAFVGNVKFKTNDFEPIPLQGNWLYADVGNYYGTAPHTFSYKDNTMQVWLRSESENETVQIAKTSFAKRYTVKCLVKAKKDFKKDSAYAYVFPNSDTIIIVGAIPENQTSFKIKIADPSPQTTFFNDLKKALKKHNIAFRQQSFNPAKNTTYPLITVTSPSLASIVKITNLYSNNLYAETLNFLLGKHFYKNGNSYNGVLAQYQLLKQNELNLNECKLYDGNGLSPLNAVSPHFFTHLLQKAYIQPFFATYKNSLPLAGKSGTLKNIGKYQQLKGKVWAKSGYMEGVRTYAGYFKADSGKTYAFCIMINHFNGSPYVAKMKIFDYLSSCIEFL